MEAIKEQETIKALSQKYQLAPQQINLWKREFLSNAKRIFSSPTKDQKSLMMKQGKRQRKQHVDSSSKLSLMRQCELLGIHRSALYCKPTTEQALNLEPMRLTDEKHRSHPWLGVARMTARLNKGYQVNHKRIERLYKLMGIASVSFVKPDEFKERLKRSLA